MPSLSFFLLTHVLTLVTAGPLSHVQRPPAPPLISSGWYASWVVPEPTISWNKYTTAIYAFAFAQNPDLKILLSIGGWTGSIYYSSAVATNASRVAFANAIEDVVTTYKLDGIDFDWEYPGSSPNQSQIGCNQFNPDDSVNFLDFLKTLRSTNVGKDLEITASVGIKPFLNGTGEPMDDVSAFGEVLNRIDQTEIMAYDIWGFWSTAVGPNAPPNDACELVQERDNRVPRSLQSLRGRNAGFPVDKERHRHILARQGL
ncbi:glycoside hydrolase superfamily [Mycena olivaceomarginata]|nr:glycoside hydrolase superfamily [Mycena olivaceomarginata]